MRPKYNHLHLIAFSVDSDDREGGSAAEIMWALRRRVHELEETGEILEAVGVPDETIDTETGLEVEVQ
jgi:Flp pilus assembly protein TadB